MTILTDAASRSTALRQERGRVDAFAFIALTLCFALAMLGLFMTANPGPDIENAEATPALIGP